MNLTAAALALAAAALFGLSTPAAKLLLDSMHPAVLAGLFYCGAGIGVALIRRAWRRTDQQSPARETPLTRQDAPWIAGAVISGGVLGPLMMMAGLQQTPAATASLLLTIEAGATALIAWMLFREHYGLRLVIGLGFLLAGSMVLAWSGVPTWTVLVGPLLIVGACIAWALDNNLTRKISLADPLQIVEIKGLVAGPVNLGLGLAAGGTLPSWPTALIAAAIGFVGYGLSLVLFVWALRELGAARTSAYFSVAPFVGAVAAVAWLHEPATPGLAAAGALMAVGVWLHLTERHEHAHRHDRLVHTHAHVHDPHHQHAHDSSIAPGEPHSHVHSHEPMTHSHPHTPDMHHGHRHD